MWEENPVARAFVGDSAAVSPFFGYGPADDESLRTRLAHLSAKGRTAPAAVAEGLREYQAFLDADPKAVGNAELLAQGAAAVVAGQQPGLLGGPLFTAYKAATAIILARRASALLGVPVVPVFWVASDDHDFSEFGNAWAVDHRGRLHEMRLAAVRGPLPAGACPVGTRALQLAGTMAEVAGRGARGPHRHTAAVTDRVMAAGRRSASLAEWFARLMAMLFSRHGLVLLDPRLPALRSRAAPVLAEAVERREEVARALATAAAALGARGFPAAFAGEDQAYVFMEEGHCRIGLIWDGRCFTDRRGQIRLSAGALADAVRREPQRFSPSAALRPVVEEALLPTLCHVAGPGELAYLAQLGGVFALLGCTMPPLAPRMSMTIVPPEVAEVMARHGLSYQDVAAGLEERLRRELSALDDLGLAQAFAGHRAALAEAYRALAPRLAPLGPGMERLLAGNRERVLRQAAYLEAKAWQHHRRRHRALVESFRLAEGWLRPGGTMQERRLSWLPAVFRLGWEFGDLLLQAPATPHHHLAYLEG